MDSDQVWLIVAQAATRAQVSRRVIYNEAKAGRLRAARVGGRRELRFRPSWVDEWLERSAPQEITPAGASSWRAA